jgi:ring-1,2-phenylacetyl-CoA epoxidase subunit PaaD
MVLEKVTNDDIIELLNEVKDPEIPTISVVELGVVRGVNLVGDKLNVTITPTYSGCPAIDVMRADITSKLSENGFNNIKIITQLTPAWTTDWMDENAKQKLLESRIAPPIGNAGDVNDLFKVIDPVVVQCTYCNSKNTRLVNQFGTTTCKALYQCNDCGQPFDYFKPH